VNNGISKTDGVNIKTDIEEIMLDCGWNRDYLGGKTG
jgi:hypothetical protein